MRICMLVEGSYPFIVGGVSSWIQMLMEGFPEHEFFIYALGAESKDRGKYKYKFPDNVVGIQEIFLDEILRCQSPDLQENILSAEERQSLYDLVTGEKPIDIESLARLFSQGNRQKNPLSIFMSSDFFDIITQVYRSKYNHLPFTDFFWTMRSMLLPLFYFFNHPLPEADVYHAVATGYCAIIGCIAARLQHKPFLITEHGIYSRERETEIVKCGWAQGDFKSVWIQYFYNIAKLAYSSATMVVTLFEQNAVIEQELGCDPKKISIVPNGIRLERFQHIPELQEHDGPLMLGGVVRVVPIKDIITMLRAFLLVQQVYPDACLKVIGPYTEDKEYYEMCRQTVSTLKLRNVEFTGSMDVAEVFPLLDIVLLSSISEGQPLVVLEGQASRRPFVTTDVGCCRELIYGRSGDDLGEAGAVVAPMDYEAMAREIIRLARDFHLRRQMGNVGYERAKNGYTYENFINTYRDIYSRLEGVSV
ncbi:MAG: GT4 family glycosyltransferase PelF [Anaerovibrio sp.]|nr:GT4 family glycosyltransferase PelF [Anaerovibrio sp.]